MVRLFLDTDFGPDCDDVGALQLLHCLCDLGEAELIGVTHCTGNTYGLPAISALNRYNNREVPLGTAPANGFLADGQVYNRPMSEQYPHEFADGREQRPAVEVFREGLSAQADASIVLCSIGPLNNLADFLKDEECCRLIERKVIRLVAMAGRFNAPGNAEWNVEMDIPAGKKVIENWPGEVVLCPWECGADVITGRVMQDKIGHPMELAYRLHSGGARSSWDPMTVLYAVRGGSGLMKASPRGNVRVLESGETVFEPDPAGRYTYIVNNAPADSIAAEIDAILAEAK